MNNSPAAVETKRGTGPIILGMPHTGLHVPPEITARLNEEGLALRDADWRVDELYDGLLADATIVRATFHRYVIDANRDPSGASLYPGQNTTGLIPIINFDGAPIWKTEPDDAEIERRRAEFHSVYHQALETEIARIKEMHGAVILYDCHSIRSTIPHLFEGRLPDLNIGTNNGDTCADEIENLVRNCAKASDFSWVVNGRFKGGWTTRRYGRPHDGVHAIQMELAQSLYLASEEPPFDYDAVRAEELRETLRTILQGLQEIAPSLTRGHAR
ncbi:MAG: N-formylglutamate deformylase [Parvularculaceae bacterium]